MDYNDLSALGVVLIGTTAFIFQIYQIFKTKNADTIHYVSCFCIILMNIMSILYYIKLNGVIGIIGCSLAILFQTIITIQKLYYSLKKTGIIPVQYIIRWLL